jgi:hypothetical protein
MPSLRLLSKSLICLLSFLAVLLTSQFVYAAPSTEFTAGLAAFRVEVDKRTLQNAIALRTVLPGQHLEITIKQNKADNFEILQGKQKLKFSKNGNLRWQAPKQVGHYPLQIIRRSDKASVTIQVFVIRPKNEVVNGKLRGYNIGSYPPALRGLTAYQAPKGFIEVTPEMRNIRVSPHFTLGQFLCKQSGGYPKYIVLQPRLLEKLELLLQTLNDKGIHSNELVVMSGYRTPFYNKAIGNVANSSHIYGGAADVFVDVKPQDNYMDDINRDGKINLEDAKTLYHLADKLVSPSHHPELMGGVGLYDKNSAHGPFVHVDVRGTPARWGH